MNTFSKSLGRSSKEEDKMACPIVDFFFSRQAGRNLDDSSCWFILVEGTVHENTMLLQEGESRNIFVSHH